MDALLASLGKLLGVFTDPVNVVLLFVCVGLAWMNRMSRKEDREDRAAMTAALTGVKEALTSLRNAISAMTGKPL